MKLVSSNKSHTTEDLSTITTYQAGVLQASTHRQLQKICDDILAPFGITKNQWLLIGTILDAGPSGIRITELAKIMGTTLSYLTNTLNLLESKGIITRVAHDDDVRSKLVTVCESFQGNCKTIEKTLRDGLRTSIYADISPEEFHVYLRVLMKLSNIH